MNDFLLEMFELILKNSKFITNIENFTFAPNYAPMNPIFQHFLTLLPSLLSSIKHLDIYVNNELSTKNLNRFYSITNSTFISYTLFYDNKFIRYF